MQLLPFLFVLPPPFVAGAAECEAGDILSYCILYHGVLRESTSSFNYIGLLSWFKTANSNKTHSHNWEQSPNHIKEQNKPSQQKTISK